VKKDDSRINAGPATDHGSRITPFVALFLVALCAGCGTPGIISDITSSYGYGPGFENTNIYGEGNYVTYDYAFTDAAAERTQKNADRHCAQRRMTAVRTSNTCSLTRCIGHYQCMKPEDAAMYGTDGR
jgi:hypothetical protein